MGMEWEWERNGNGNVCTQWGGGCWSGNGVSAVHAHSSAGAELHSCSPDGCTPRAGRAKCCKGGCGGGGAASRAAPSHGGAGSASTAPRFANPSRHGERRPPRSLLPLSLLFLLIDFLSGRIGGGMDLLLTSSGASLQSAESLVPGAGAAAPGLQQRSAALGVAEVVGGMGTVHGREL